MAEKRKKVVSEKSCPEKQPKLLSFGFDIDKKSRTIEQDNISLQTTGDKDELDEATNEKSQKEKPCERRDPSTNEKPQKEKLCDPSLHFQEKWLKEFPWLFTEDNVMKCRVCVEHKSSSKFAKEGSMN